MTVTYTIFALLVCAFVFCLGVIHGSVDDDDKRMWRADVAVFCAFVNLVIMCSTVVTYVLVNIVRI